jgi:hypothetical protein
MMNDYYVFDDILSKEEQELLYDYVNTKNIKWEIIENITGDYGGNADRHHFPAKVHPQMYCKENNIDNIINNLQIKIANKIDLEFVQNYRWKINWTSPINNDYNPMDLLHYDRINEHIVIVYYINDSTGDTNIYNHKDGNNAETFKENFQNINFNSYELLASVSPKMGRCVVFNGKLAHYGNHPIGNDRFVINLNFVGKSKKIKNIL